MLLILNCMVNDTFAESFNRAVRQQVGLAGSSLTAIRVREAKELGDISLYTHLLISGSEASTTEDNPWDDLVENAIHKFLADGKPILGICYGHQFLARTLGGKQCVRRAEKPELGWAQIQLQKNPLFDQIDNPVCMVAHYDEVCNLPQEFNIIASSKHCPVHAFQYAQLPVWGVQFHPEYGAEEGREIFTVFKSLDENFSKFYDDKLLVNYKPRLNSLFIKNFISL